MVVLVDSDKVGMALGILVFMVMILMGLHGGVSPAVVIARGLVGFTVAYFFGFVLSRFITNTLVTAMATERARRLAEITKKPKKAEEGEETEEESGAP